LADLVSRQKVGQEKWEQTIRTAKPATVRHEKASHANTTLVTDGKHLVASSARMGCIASI
jgi:hypothetical protein